MRSLRYCLFFFLCLSLDQAKGTEYAPWFHNLFEFKANIAYQYIEAEKVQSSEGDFDSPFPYDNAFLFGLGISPFPRYDFQAELIFSNNTKIEYGYQAFLTTVRYLWLDDISGDPLSLATGITLSFPAERFLRNVNYFYHSHVNGEFHLSVGKEYPNDSLTDWKRRWWVLAGIGIADQGTGWIHSMIEAAWNWYPRVNFGLFSELLFGLGNKSAFLPFEGYKLVDYRVIDAGVSIEFSCLPKLIMAMEFAYRLYAKNAPEHSSFICLKLSSPFSF
jgi:hypothetical protein